MAWRMLVVLNELWLMLKEEHYRPALAQTTCAIKALFVFLQQGGIWMGAWEYTYLPELKEKKEAEENDGGKGEREEAAGSADGGSGTNCLDRQSNHTGMRCFASLESVARHSARNCSPSAPPRQITRSQSPAPSVVEHLRVGLCNGCLEQLASRGARPSLSALRLDRGLARAAPPRAPSPRSTRWPPLAWLLLLSAAWWG